MAEQINWKVLVAVIVVAFVLYSLFGGTTTGFGTASEGTLLGTPATKLCTDSDGENNLARGSCFDNSGEKKVDKCADTNTAMETYCSPSNQCSYKFKNCPFGYQCAGGACLKIY